MRSPRLAHRSAAAHKLHSTPQQHRMNLISGSGETSSRLPILSLFLPGSCPNNRDRRIVFEFPFGRIVDTGMACRRDGIIPPDVDIMTIHKEAAAIRAACNRKAQEEEQLNVLPFRRAV